MWGALHFLPKRRTYNIELTSTSVWEAKSLSGSSLYLSE